MVHVDLARLKTTRRAGCDQTSQPGFPGLSKGWGSVLSSTAWQWPTAHRVRAEPPGRRGRDQGGREHHPSSPGMANCPLAGYPTSRPKTLAVSRTPSGSCPATEGRPGCTSPDAATCDDCPPSCSTPLTGDTATPSSTAPTAAPGHHHHGHPLRPEEHLHALLPLCEKCRYSDRDRRFHAEPNACPVRASEPVRQEGAPMGCPDPIEKTTELLRAGYGGCQGPGASTSAPTPRAATPSSGSGAQGREEKPLAVMAGPGHARMLARVSPRRKALAGPERPIVLL